MPYGGSEGAARKRESMRAQLDVDKRQLEEMDRLGKKRDLFGRDRAKLLADIKQLEARIRISGL